MSLIGEYPEARDQEKRLKHITRIKSSVHNLTQILNDFLSLSKLEEGVVRNQPEFFDLVEFSKDTMEEMRPMMKTGQNIFYKHIGNINKAFLDKQLLKNVLFNLISNAIKYSPEDREINFETHCENDKVIVIVRDQGIGIPKDDQQFLFQRFFRAKNAGNEQGTGLGLNIVKKYIELMGGEIAYKSTVNEGTIFTIKFFIK